MTTRNGNTTATKAPAKKAAEPGGAALKTRVEELERLVGEMRTGKWFMDMARSASQAEIESELASNPEARKRLAQMLVGQQFNQRGQ